MTLSAVLLDIPKNVEMTTLPVTTLYPRERYGDPHGPSDTLVFGLGPSPHLPPGWDLFLRPTSSSVAVKVHHGPTEADHRPSTTIWPFVRLPLSDFLSRMVRSSLRKRGTVDV